MKKTCKKIKNVQIKRWTKYLWKKFERGYKFIKKKKMKKNKIKIFK